MSLWPGPEKSVTPFWVRGARLSPAGPSFSPPFPEAPMSDAPQLPVVWSADLRDAPHAQPSWLWQGYLTPGSVTLLTSQWKSGKTTLVSLLLARLSGGGTFAGLPLAAGKAVVVSEESLDHWQRRRQRLDFGDGVALLCRPFRGKPTPDEWLALLDGIAGLHAQHGLSLVVIDTLATFFPG